MDGLVGNKLGEYDIIGHIGHGVAADVYKAFQPKLNRHVAIKVLSPVFADEEAFRVRFVREAQAVAQLDHPNILPVYDFDRQGNLVYIVMQYVDTGSLDDLMGQPLPLDLALRILEQVGSALGYAHERGIIHRDVKPANVLLGPGYWALLSDFGLVKVMEAPSSLTPSGMSLGTPAYMAPEQVTGERVDQRADIYALGATLYQMVTGRVPFEGGTGMAVAFKHLSEALVPPRGLNPNLPPPVDKVIVKALAKERDLRYQTMKSFVSAFREAVEGTKARATHIAPPLRGQGTPAVAPARHLQTSSSPPPLPIPLEAIWPPADGQAVTDEECAARGGRIWGLLATILGTLGGLFALLWAFDTWFGRTP